MNDVARGRPQAGGGVLALCVVLTVLGPLIAVSCMADEYAAAAPFFDTSPGLRVAVLVSVLLTAASIGVGMRAGIGLWSVRPGAVTDAKQALLFGLAVDAVTTTLHHAFSPLDASQGRLIVDVTLAMLPNLVFFTVCYSYLNRSRRVHELYRDGPG